MSATLLLGVLTAEDVGGDKAYDDYVRRQMSEQLANELRYKRRADDSDVRSYAVRRELAAVEVQAHMDNARLMIAENKLDQADYHIQQAQIISNGVPESLTEENVLFLEELADISKEMRTQDDSKLDRTERLRLQRDATERVQREARSKRNDFYEKLARVMAYQQRGLNEVALEHCRQLINEHPTNETVKALYEETLDRVHEDRKLSYEERMEDLKEEVFQRVHQSLIPQDWDGTPSFSDDWLDRVAKREIPYSQVDLPDWQLALQNQLAERISISFSELNAAEAIDMLANQTGISFIIDTDVRSGSERLVAINARQMRLENILNWICRQADLKWQYRDGALFIGEEVSEESILRMYDVGQLLAARMDFVGPRLAFQSGDDISGGFDLFGDEEPEEMDPDDLVDFIVQVVDPEAWEDGASIDISGSNLLVYASPTTHLRLQDFLITYLQTDEIVVNTEVRFLDIGDTVMEEIGVDWRNSGLVSGLSSAFGLFDSNDTRQLTANVTNILPGNNLSFTGGASADPGMVLNWGYLGVTELATIFTAVQRKQRGRELGAVSVSVRNGSKGYSFVGQNVAYIEDYEVVLNDVAANLDPIIGSIMVGMSVEVRPLVSSDRRYVSLDLQPIRSDLTFNIAVLRTNWTYQVSANLFLTLSLEFPLELPVVNVSSTASRVTVPDEGTVILGGFKRNIEQHAKAQVPVLGNIPFLGRLFGRRGLYSERSRLFITVKPKIVLYNELEMEL